MSQGPQTFDPIKNPNPELGDDRDYCARMVHAAFAARYQLPKDDAVENEAAGFPNQPDINYWVDTAILGRGYTWGPYWWDNKIVGDGVHDPLFQAAGPGGGAEGGSVPNVEKGGGAHGSLINAQLGLLEDDIAYRLALLAVNILQPLKDKYPNIIVTSGFRQNNTGIGQHELGEACDIQIHNQTPELLYEVADYISKFLNFDILILNWTTVGTGEPWIHVSFSPKSLRSTVLTKDFADVFHEGLFIIEPLSGEALAAAQREQAAQDELILSELQTLQSRQVKLGTVPPEVTDANTSATASSGDGSGIIDGGGTPSLLTGPGFGLDSVTIVSSPDVRNWAETTSITEWGMTPGTMHLVFNKQSSWPGVDIGGAVQQATLWVFLKINDQWYATAAERLRPSQSNKPENQKFSKWIGTDWLYDRGRWGVMTGYVPRIGERVGVMVTQGSERSDSTWTVTERSNVFWFEWPKDDTSLSLP
jgi:hypothetical protein